MMDGKREPASKYHHDNLAFTQDFDTSNYNSRPSQNNPDYSGGFTKFGNSDPPPYDSSSNFVNNQQPQPMTTDPYAKDFGPRLPPILNPYGYEVGPSSRHAGYGQYSNDHTIITLNQPAVGSVPNYFGLALFVTLCCCWPLGLSAISQNNEAKRQAASGNIEGAREKAAESKRTSLIGIFAGIVFLGAAIGIGVWYYYKVRQDIDSKHSHYRY